MGAGNLGKWLIFNVVFSRMVGCLDWDRELETDKISEKFFCVCL